jgi:hypothetical protein
MVEGWVTFKYKDGTAERRFIPLGQKERSRHCKSCLYFKKSYGGYCELQPDAFIDAEAEACDSYVNRTWGRKNE